MNLVVEDLVQRFPVPARGDRPAGIATGLDRLSLTTGEIGPSGCGKSTLLRILAGLDVPTSGRVAFDGQPLPRDEDALRRYRRTVGTVFQAYNVFPHLTAMQNLLLPLVHVHGLSERVREPLARFRLAEHAHKRPAELSGGPEAADHDPAGVQPRRLFLDEPTSALDPEMRAKVIEMIAEVRAEGAQFVLVTHEMAFARRVADEIAFVADGQVLVRAAAGEFFDHQHDPRVRSFLQLTLAS
ncbi:MAG: ATP-binding cassette domain-containing protein [Pirellulales bacterium]